MLVPNLVRDIVERALAEDLAGGDLTTEATVPENLLVVGRAIARSATVACGADVFAKVFYAVDASVRVEGLVEDGTWAEPGQTLWEVEGSARSILLAERTALNFVQRLSGIATLARRFVDALPKGCTTRITDTRKTTPGMRHLERYAVRIGGAHNHRDMLGSAILIKDNHIEAAGGIATAVARARHRAPHTSRIEIRSGVIGTTCRGAEGGRRNNHARQFLASTPGPSRHAHQGQSAVGGFGKGNARSHRRFGRARHRRNQCRCADPFCARCGHSARY